MQNILIVIPNLNNPAGTERAGINLANLLVPQHSVIILSLTPKTCEPFFHIKPDVKIEYKDVTTNKPKPFNKLNWFCRCYFEINKLIKEQNIDIVIGLTHNVNCVISLLKRKNVKVVGSEHIDYKSIPAFSKRIIEKVYPRLDALVTLSEEAYKSVKHLNSNTVVINNPLSFETSKKSSLTNKKIIMVGRLSKEKGYDRIIPLSKYLTKQFPDWKINIYGEGDLKRTLVELIKANNLSNIELKGTTKNIMTEYLNSSIFISASYNEAFGMVILEAMQCGLPVISYEHQGSRSLISNGVNGMIVHNEFELINQTSRLIMSLDTRQKLGNSGRLTSYDYTADKVKEKWLQLIRSLD